MRNAPKQFSYAAAGVINAAAFMTKSLDEKNLSNTMTIRDPNFLKASLRVDKAKARSNIALIEAHTYSVKRPNFSGWEEQETGKGKPRKRGATVFARGGSKTGRVQAKYRFKSQNKFYNPKQFQGKSEKDRFMFMMRVMNTRGGGNFLLSNSLQTKRGKINAGLYYLKDHKIRRLQKLGNIKTAKVTHWRTMSLQQLRTEFKIGAEWEKQIKFYVDLFKKNTK